MTAMRAVIERANLQIRNLRLAGGRDFCVSGYADGLIVEQDMREALFAAAESMEELVEWIQTELRLQHKGCAE